jgi:large subunit ribosomal protein L1
MANRGKKYTEKAKKIEKTLYSIDDAIKIAKRNDYTSFDSSIDLHLSLKLPAGKEPKSVKGTMSLPNPVKQEDVKVVVFCAEEDTDKALKAGAIEAGLDKLIKKIQDGWTDFDIAIAVPSVMPQIAILGKELGPKGLMPNPKTGTLREDFDKAIEEFQKGKSQWACDEGAVVHLAVGNKKMEDKKIIDNIVSAVNDIAKTVGRQVSTLVKTAYLSPTMGPSAQIKKEELE